MNTMFFLTGTFGFAVFAAGFVLNYWISKRRFHRRAITGIQLFRSYKHFYFTRIFEGIGKLIAWVLMIFGLMELLGSIIMPSLLRK